MKPGRRRAGSRGFLRGYEFNGEVCARRLLAAQPEIPFHRGFRDTDVKPGKFRVAVRRVEGKGGSDVRGRRAIRKILILCEFLIIFSHFLK